MRPVRRRRRYALPALVALTVAVSGLAACRGGEAGRGELRLDGRGGLDAAATARLLRRGDPVRTSGAVRGGGVSAPVGARISWRPARAVLRFALIADGRAYRVQVRSLGTEAWVRRPRAVPGAAEAPHSWLAPRGERRWVAIPQERLSALGLVTPYDPAALLEMLARFKVRLRPSGTGSVRGAAAVRFTTRADPPRVLLPAGAQALEVWVARADGRPVRVVLALPDGRIRYDISSAAVPEVRPPEREAIQPPAPPPAPPEPTGPFAVVTEGEQAGVRYRVLAAPGSRGSTCWKVESSPPYTSALGSNASGATCASMPGANLPLHARVVIVVDTDERAPFEMLGVLLPPGATAELWLSDGTRRALLPVDDRSGLALWVGPPRPLPGFLAVRLGEEVAQCTVADVLEPSDLSELGPDDEQTARGFPWACIPG